MIRDEPGELIPRLRGVSHAAACLLALAAAIVLLVLADGTRATVAVVVYGIGLVALFGGSALYHRWPGPGRFKLLLRRIDHSTIFVVIAASYAQRRPNPWPHTFGFHEVFHALVILAAAAHYVAMIGWVVPEAGA